MLAALEAPTIVSSRSARATPGGADSDIRDLNLPVKLEGKLPVGRRQTMSPDLMLSQRHLGMIVTRLEISNLWPVGPARPSGYRGHAAPRAGESWARN